jgi:hypothetical protein
MLSVVNLSSGCQSNVEDRRSSFKALVRALWATATCSVVVPTVAPCRTVAFSSRRGLQMSGTALEIYLVGKKNGGIVGCFLSIVETANPSHQIGDIVSQ